MKIVIVIHSGIGNLIMTTPCAKALVSLGHEVVICTWARSYKILEGWDVATVTMDHPSIHTMSADHVIVSACGSIWQDEWTKGTVWRAGPKTIPWVKHEVEYYMDVAQELGYSGHIPDYEVCLQPMNEGRADDFVTANRIEKFICINASFLRSDHWHLKHLGDQKYSMLLGRLHHEYPGHKFVFVGEGTDHITANDIFKRSGSVPQSVFVNACGWTNDIRNTAALIARSDIIVGNDGGLMHVAAALGIPTVTIFTFTNPIKNKPYHDLGIELMVPCDKRMMCQHGKFDGCRENGCFDLSVETVMQAAQQWI